MSRELEPWREQITSWIQDNCLMQQAVLDKLSNVADLHISRATLTRQLKAWSVTRGSHER